jgi:hypothetical protein
MAINIREHYRLWLTEHLDISGLLACGVGFVDKSSVSFSCLDQWPPAALEVAMRCLSDAFDVAHLHRIGAQEQRWDFEHARIHCVRRPDKIMLALFVSKAEPGGAGLEKMQQEFIAFHPLD